MRPRRVRGRQNVAVRPCALSLAITPEKLHGVGLEHVGEFFQHVDRRGMLLAFEHPDVIAVDGGTVGKLLL